MLVPSLLSTNKTLVIAVKKYAKADIRVFQFSSISFVSNILFGNADVVFVLLLLILPK